MGRISIRVITFLLVVFTIACKQETKKKITTAPITFTKEGQLTIHKTKDSLTKITFDIEIAETEYETQTGLMYREHLEKNQGMLFIFDDTDYRSFYMKNTKIGLDIIYIDENLKIVSFQKNAKPLDETGLPSNIPAKYVFEINAGLADKHQLEVGDIIDYNSIEP